MGESGMDWSVRADLTPATAKQLLEDIKRDRQQLEGQPKRVLVEYLADRGIVLDEKFLAEMVHLPSDQKIDEILTEVKRLGHEGHPLFHEPHLTFVLAASVQELEEHTEKA